MSDMTAELSIPGFSHERRDPVEGIRSLIRHVKAKTLHLDTNPEEARRGLTRESVVLFGKDYDTQKPHVVVVAPQISTDKLESVDKAKNTLVSKGVRAIHQLARDGKITFDQAEEMRQEMVLGHVGIDVTVQNERELMKAFGRNLGAKPEAVPGRSASSEAAPHVFQVKSIREPLTPKQKIRMGVIAIGGLSLTACAVVPPPEATPTVPEPGQLDKQIIDSFLAANPEYKGREILTARVTVNGKPFDTVFMNSTQDEINNSPEGTVLVDINQDGTPDQSFQTTPESIIYTTIMDADGNTHWEKLVGVAYKELDGSVTTAWFREGELKQVIFYNSKFPTQIAFSPPTVDPAKIGWDGKTPFYLNVSDSISKVLAKPALTTENTATPTAEATAESSYVEKLKAESIVEHVETEYNGAPVNVNVYSHESIKTYQFVEMNKVLLDQEFKNDSGEDYKKATAHAILQALAQAWREGGSAEAFAQVIKGFMTGNKEANETAVPLFADDLETEGYNPSMREFFPVDPETKQPNEVNIVFMNVPAKDFPGADLKYSWYNGSLAIGRAIDKDGNLYIFLNHYPAEAASMGYVKISEITTIMVVDGLESLSWKNGKTDIESFIKAKYGKIYLSFSRNAKFLFNTDPDYTNWKP